MQEGGAVCAMDPLAARPAQTAPLHVKRICIGVFELKISLIVRVSSRQCIASRMSHIKPNSAGPSNRWWLDFG